MEISLDGKVALVTGVGPNIGSGVALALSKYGARVACNDVDQSAIKACIARIERNGGEAMAAPGDVTDEAAVQGYNGSVLERSNTRPTSMNGASSSSTEVEIALNVATLQRSSTELENESRS